MGYKSVYVTCALVVLCLNTLQINSCQSVEQRFKFPNSDIYLRLVRAAPLQYQVMRGNIAVIFKMKILNNK